MSAPAWYWYDRFVGVAFDLACLGGLPFRRAMEWRRKLLHHVHELVDDAEIAFFQDVRAVFEATGTRERANRITLSLAVALQPAGGGGFDEKEACYQDVLAHLPPCDAPAYEAAAAWMEIIARAVFTH